VIDFIAVLLHALFCFHPPSVSKEQQGFFYIVTHHSPAAVP
jgi:hypothetical protein